MYVYVHITFPLGCFRMGIPKMRGQTFGIIWNAYTPGLYLPQKHHQSSTFLSDTNAQCQDLWKQQIQDQAF